MLSAAPSLSPPSKSMAAKLKSGGVAMYLLRSVDWRSLRADPEDEKLEPEDCQVDNCVKDSKNSGDATEIVETELEAAKTPEEIEAEPTASVDDRSEAAPQAKANTFQVSYQYLPDADASVGDESTSSLHIDGDLHRSSLQYSDVLLQTDEHGIGINVGVGTLGEGEGDGKVLVVQSFRRRNEFDVGPAEACGKIQVGDILHAVDGEGVSSLLQLRAKLTGRLGTPRKFVLLRFLRPLKDPRDLTSAPCVFNPRTVRECNVHADQLPLSVTGALLRNNPDVAVLVRQLAMANQLLQDQLVANKLKLEEQRIQLDQLHALYARTQAESLPLFSLSKSIRPFSRRSNASTANDIGTEKSIPSKIQIEVMDAVNAEYDRLRQEFQQQLVHDKRELEMKYAERSQRLHEATEKKVEMLEAGFQQALQYHAIHLQCCCHHSTSTTTRIISGMRSQKVGGSEFAPGETAAISDDEITANCENEDMASNKLQQVLDVLTKYETMRHARTVKLQELRFCGNEGIRTENNSEI